MFVYISSGPDIVNGYHFVLLIDFIQNPPPGDFISIIDFVSFKFLNMWMNPGFCL